MFWGPGMQLAKPATSAGNTTGCALAMKSFCCAVAPESLVSESTKWPLAAAMVPLMVGNATSGVGVVVGVPRGGVGVGLGFTIGVAVGVGDGVGARDGEGSAEGGGVAVGVGVRLTLGLGIGVALGTVPSPLPPPPPQALTTRRLNAASNAVFIFSYPIRCPARIAQREATLKLVCRGRMVGITRRALGTRFSANYVTNSCEVGSLRALERRGARVVEWA